MKIRLFGIFGKVFFYTLLILVLVISVMVVFFADQIKSAVAATQRDQIAQVFDSLIDRAAGKSEEEIVRIAREFHTRNASFEFAVMTANRKILYQTEHFKLPLPDRRLPELDNIIVNREALPGKFQFTTSLLSDKLQFATILAGNVRLLVSGTASAADVYRAFVEKTFVAFLLLLLASIAAAALFAHRIARPIRKMAADARQMSLLKPVPPPAAVRKDEIGQLEEDVYKMYTALKSTIRQLETEIRREKEMEENQRYFFSAASHELKTPIAATSALLEGMLGKVIEPPEYPAALRECLRMMREQNKLVSEILDIVALNNHALAPRRDRINLREYIGSVMPLYLPLAETRKMTVRVDVADHLVCAVDTKLFGKALGNVILNAIQNTPDGGLIEVSAAETESGRIRLCVLNRDVSIPEEVLRKLFEPFYREDKARNREQGRSGLGLTIVRKALDLMGIPCALENTDRGVLFRMDLPVAEQQVAHERLDES